MWLQSCAQNARKNGGTPVGFFVSKNRQRVLPYAIICRVMKEKRERWMELAAQVADEQDPEKLSRLISELVRLLDEKQARVSRESTPSEPPK
jgi:hypothetical protein